MRNFAICCVSLLFWSCSGLGGGAVMNNSMTFDELGALQCKTTMQKMIDQKGDEPLTYKDAENSPQCPVAKLQTYADSIRAAKGKTCAEATITCQGEHHKAAGYERDYPRSVPGKGIIDSEKDGIRVPPCFAVLLPEQAKVVSTGAEGSTPSLTFSTTQDLKPLAEGYHQMLNGGQARVLAGDAVDSGVAGKLGGIEYQMTFDKKAQLVHVTWSPPLMNSTPKS